MELPTRSPRNRSLKYPVRDPIQVLRAAFRERQHTCMRAGRISNWQRVQGPRAVTKVKVANVETNASNPITHIHKFMWLIYLCLIKLSGLGLKSGFRKSGDAFFGEEQKRLRQRPRPLKA